MIERQIEASLDGLMPADYKAYYPNWFRISLRKQVVREVLYLIENGIAPTIEMALLETFNEFSEAMDGKTDGKHYEDE